MILPVLIVLGAVGTVWLHLVALVYFRNRKNAPPLIDMSGLAVNVGGVVIGLMASRVALSGTWSLPDSISAMFVVAVVVAWAAWILGVWAGHLREVAESRIELWSALGSCAAGAILGATVAAW